MNIPTGLAFIEFTVVTLVYMEHKQDNNNDHNNDEHSRQCNRTTDSAVL